MSGKELNYSQNENALHGLEERNKIRDKMGMYAGGNGISSLHVLIREPNDNAIDEWNVKPFEKIKIKIDSKNNICSVRDYGRGIPYVTDSKGESVLKKAVSILHMGGKHNNNSNHLLSEEISDFKGNYQFSSGINGVGITLTNYASDDFNAIVFNEENDEKAYVSYHDGYLKSEGVVKLNEPLDLYDSSIDSFVYDNNELVEDIKTGTMIVFKPSIKEDAFDDDGVFDEGISFDKEIVVNQLKTLPYLNPGLIIELQFDDEVIIFDKKEEFKQIIDDENKSHLIFKENLYFKEHMIYAQNKETKKAKVFSLEEFIKQPYEFRKNQNIKETVFEIAFNFIEGSKEPFKENNVNGSIIISGGKQDQNLKQKLKQYINDFIDENYKKIGHFEVDDIMANFSFMFQVKINEPKFAGQTKDKLDNSELTQFSNYFFKKYLKWWINREDKKSLDKLIKILEANRKAREDTNKVRDNVFKEIFNKSDDALLSNTKKLTKCKSKVPELCELFLVEGDSAAGPAKASRVDEYQAVLPLKGKLLNALKGSDVNKMLKNEEIINLISALECGIGKEYDYSKLRYHKIVLLTDKDIDGLHIRNLNTVFFYVFYKELIQKGHLYIADAPLYGIKTKKGNFYAWTIEERDEIIERLKSESTRYEVTRFKGLGEMNDEQLYETTLNKEHRKLIQVKMNDFSDIEDDLEEVIDVIEEKDVDFVDFQELIHVYMDNRKEDKLAREKLINEYYSTSKEKLIKLKSPSNA